MFEKGLEDVLRGYTSEQYAESLHNTLLNYLRDKGILNFQDYQNYINENFKEILQKNN